MQTEHLKRLAIHVIDRGFKYSTGTPDATDGSVEVVDPRYMDDVERFNRYYNTTVSDNYKTPSDSLRQLEEYFKNFDPVNAVGDFNEWSGYRWPSLDAMQIAHDYMTGLGIDKELLQTTERDHMVHALFSYLLYWTDEGLMAFRLKFPTFEWVASMLLLEKGRAPVYVTDAGVPFIRSAFRLMTRWLNRRTKDIREGVERPQFRITTHVSPDLIEHFKDVYRRLLTESLDSTELEASMVSPFAAVAEHFGGSCRSRLNVSQKVITGVACCGKTTLLNELKSCGWTVCSRADLGTFSGKCKSAAAIAGLHAAMDSALRRGDVLGDRGPIDNPLWSIIMPLCDPKYRDTLVEQMLTFFIGFLNEHVIAYMVQQIVVIFIDQYPSLNRKRMLRRCSNGDAFRARLEMYPITQFMAYYMAARLFGWTVRCVPYDDERVFRPDRYRAIADEMKTLFGRPIEQPPLTLPASRPDGMYVTEKEYSIATGIFK